MICLGAPSRTISCIAATDRALQETGTDVEKDLRNYSKSSLGLEPPLSAGTSLESFEEGKANVANMFLHSSDYNNISPLNALTQT